MNAAKVRELIAKYQHRPAAEDISADEYDELEKAVVWISDQPTENGRESAFVQWFYTLPELNARASVDEVLALERLEVARESTFSAIARLEAAGLDDAAKRAEEIERELLHLLADTKS